LEDEGCGIGPRGCQIQYVEDGHGQHRNGRLRHQMQLTVRGWTEGTVWY
jgi:hypothetical protein